MEDKKQTEKVEEEKNTNRIEKEKPPVIYRNYTLGRRLGLR